MTESGNGRRATIREVNAKLDLIKAEQQTAHMKTRLVVVIVMAVHIIGLQVGPYLLGYFGL